MRKITSDIALDGAPTSHGMVSPEPSQIPACETDLSNGAFSGNFVPFQPHIKCRFQHPNGYPKRQMVPDDKVTWDAEFPGYAPPYYVAQVVLDNDRNTNPKGWADPEEFAQICKSKTGYEKEYRLDSEGRALNPRGRTGLAGRGLLGAWGTNFAADPIITRINPENGLLEMIAIERGDCGQWAIPGGMVERGQTVSQTLEAELGQEAHVELDFSTPAILYRGYVDDPRNTDHAWMETTVAHFHFDAEAGKNITPEAGDDAKQAGWQPLTSGFISQLYASHADFVIAALKHIYTKQYDSLPDAAKQQLREIFLA